MLDILFFDPMNFLHCLPLMGMGMGAVCTVMGVIIVITLLLCRCLANSE